VIDQIDIDAAPGGETPELRCGLTNQATMIFPSSLAFPAAAHFFFSRNNCRRQDGHSYQWAYQVGFELVFLAHFLLPSTPLDLD
jgi:hypothetical protein